MNRRNFVSVCFTATAGLFACSIGRSDTTDLSLKLPTSPKSSSIDLSRLLACIALVETGGDDRKVGKSGERSKYQIGETVWRQYEPSYDHKYCYGLRAYRVGLSHISWLHSHIGPSVFALALGWHVGLDNWRAARFQLPERYYGERVRNLYNEPTTKLT